MLRLTSAAKRWHTGGHGFRRPDHKQVLEALGWGGAGLLLSYLALAAVVGFVAR